HAFQAGGHHQMARRLEAVARPSVAPASELSLGDRAAVSRAMGAAFEEIDRRDFRAEGVGERAAPSGTWAAVEPGRDGPTERRSVWPLPASVQPSDSLPPSPAMPIAPVRHTISTAPSAPPPPTFPPPAWRAPLSAERFARDGLCVFPRDHSAAV